MSRSRQIRDEKSPQQLWNPLQQAQSPFVENLFGLWVPRRIVDSEDKQNPGPETPAIIRFAVTTVGWNDLTGLPSTVDSVLERLRKYSLQQLMGLVGRITLALSAATDTDASTVQLNIATRLLGPEAATAVFDIVRQKASEQERRDGFALFHERQILNALKLAFLTIDCNSPAASEDPSVLHFVEALLMLNDLIDPPEGAMGPGTPGGPQAMELYVSANMLFNESPSILEDLVRAHFLYIEHRSEVIAKSSINVPIALARQTKLEAEIAWRALYALYAFWASSDLADIDAGSIAVRRSNYLSTLPMLSDDERDTWFALATWSAPDLQARIRGDYTVKEPRYWDVLPFEERPLIAFGDLLYCSSVPLMRRLAGSSIQHRLQDRTAFTGKETRAFRDTRGQLVEYYTQETFKRSFGNRFIAERELLNAARGSSVCDGLIVYPDGVILIECKASSPLLDTRQGKNYDKYRQQWQLVMRKAASQLNSTIELLRRGAFTSLGIIPEMLKNVFPVVCVFEMPVHPLTYRVVRQTDLADHPLTENMNTGVAKPLQLLQIKEVDMWELASEHGQSILELLRKKTATEEMTEISFHHFLHITGQTFQNSHSQWHARRFSLITDSARRYFRQLGLEPADNTDDDVMATPS